MRFMTIEWPELGLKVRARMEDERNPELCEEVWKNLPFDCVQEHATVTGKEFYAWVPMVSMAPADYQETYVDAPVGRVFYSRLANKICMKYGDCTEDVPGPCLALIPPEDVPKLTAAGVAAWNNYFTAEKKVIIVRFGKE